MAGELTKNIAEVLDKLSWGVGDKVLGLDASDLIGGLPKIKQFPVPSGGGGLAGAPRRVVVNMDLESAEAGVSYPTLTEAIAYVNTLSPAPSLASPVNVIVQGNYTPVAEESIQLPLATNLVGESLNMVTNVAIDPPGLSFMDPDMPKYFIFGLLNMHFAGELRPTYKSGGGLVNMVGFQNCTFTGSVASGTVGGEQATLVLAMNTLIFSGDWSNVLQLRVTNSYIAPMYSDILLSNIVAYNTLCMADEETTPFGLTMLEQVGEGVPRRAFIGASLFLHYPASGQDFSVVGTLRGTNSDITIKSSQLKLPAGTYFTLVNCYYSPGYWPAAPVRIEDGAEVSLEGGFVEAPLVFEFDIDAEGQSARLSITGTALSDKVTIGRVTPGAIDGTCQVRLASVPINTGLNHTIVLLEHALRVEAEHCLWDDEPTVTPSSTNFYSAAKIHSLLT